MMAAPALPRRSASRAGTSPLLAWQAIDAFRTGLGPFRGTHASGTHGSGAAVAGRAPTGDRRRVRLAATGHQDATAGITSCPMTSSGVIS